MFEALVAPGNVSELRRLVLDLAVRGLLTPQLAQEAPPLVRRKAAAPDDAEGLRPFPIPSSWDWATIDEVCCDSFYGPRFGKGQYVTHGGFPTIRTTDMTDSGEIVLRDAPLVRVAADKLPLYQVQQGDLLITRTGSIGIMAVFSGDYVALPSAYLIRFRFWKESVTARFIYTFLKSSCGQERLGLGTTTTAQPNVNATTIRAISVPIPPLAEQKRIVARVEQLMALIDDLEAKQSKKRDLSTRLTKASLEALTTAESHEDFETAWQRVVENFAVLLDKSADVDEVRSAVLNAAVRGHFLARSSARFAGHLAADQGPFWIPPGWRWATIDEICVDSFYGPRFGKNEYVLSGGTPTIRTTDMSDDGRIVLRDAPCVRVDPKKVDLYRVVDGDLLVTRTGSIGTMAVFRGTYEAIPSAYLIRFRFAPTVLPEYVYLCLKSPYGQALLGLGTTRVAQPNVNATSIRAMSIPIPPLVEQERVLASVNRLMKFCDDLEAKLRRAEDRASKLVEAVVQEMVA
jgi:type I restriction enzyme S subunit